MTQPMGPAPEGPNHPGEGTEVAPPVAPTPVPTPPPVGNPEPDDDL